MGVSDRPGQCKCRAVANLAQEAPSQPSSPLILPRASQRARREGPDLTTFCTMDETPDGRVRIDKWLWAARFYKTRALAAEAIAGGKVQVNGERVKRAKPLQVGDEVRIRQGPYEYQIMVRELSDRRGPAVLAAALYEEKAESRAAREVLALQLKSLHSVFLPERGRPTKKDRREINRLKGRE
jgi:ribosome-associated heat shock protein Hsp15